MEMALAGTSEKQRADFRDLVDFIFREKKAANE